MSKFLEIAQIFIPPPPIEGVGLTLVEIIRMVRLIGDFFTTVGAILAAIFIIISGIVYMKAGGDAAKIINAKGWLKNSLIGAFLVIGVGLIVNTIANVVTREFFCTFQINLPFLGVCVF